jgi:hypothetical protein
MQLVHALSDWIPLGSTIMVWTHLNLSEERKAMKEVRMKKIHPKLMVSLFHTFHLTVL